MTEHHVLGLKLVDGLTLDAAYRAALRPGEPLRDAAGRTRRLPRFFYEVDSWKTAQRVELAPHFTLSEFLRTDVREAAVLRAFPRYVPCAVTVLAAHLAVFRQKVGTYVYLAANGGYRSPGHAHTRGASTHHWGTAVNIYRIGDDYLDGEERIEAYRKVAHEALPAVWSRPYGHAVGFADDHLHLDLGYVTVVPHEAAGEPDAPDEPDEAAGEQAETARGK